MKCFLACFLMGFSAAISAQNPIQEIVSSHKYRKAVVRATDGFVLENQELFYVNAIGVQRHLKHVVGDSQIILFKDHLLLLDGDILSILFENQNPAAWTWATISTNITEVESEQNHLYVIQYEMRRNSRRLSLWQYDGPPMNENWAFTQSSGVSMYFTGKIWIPMPTSPKVFINNQPIQFKKIAVEWPSGFARVNGVLQLQTMDHHDMILSEN